MSYAALGAQTKITAEASWRAYRSGGSTGLSTHAAQVGGAAAGAGACAATGVGAAVAAFCGTIGAEIGKWIAESAPGLIARAEGAAEIKRQDAAIQAWAEAMNGLDKLLNDSVAFLMEVHGTTDPREGWIRLWRDGNLRPAPYLHAPWGTIAPPADPRSPAYHNLRLNQGAVSAPKDVTHVTPMLRQSGGAWKLDSAALRTNVESMQRYADGVVAAVARGEQQIRAEQRAAVAARAAAFAARVAGEQAAARRQRTLGWVLLGVGAAAALGVGWWTLRGRERSS